MERRGFLSTLNNLKIGVRLGAGFAVVLALLAATVGLGTMALGNLNEEVEGLVKKDWVKSQLASNIATISDTNAKLTLEMVMTPDAATRTKMAEQITKNREQNNKYYAQLDPMLYTAEGKALFAAMQDTRKPYTAAFDQVGKLSAEGKLPEAQAVTREQMVPALEKYLKSIEDFGDQQSKLVDKRGETALSIAVSPTLQRQRYALRHLVTVLPMFTAPLLPESTGLLTLTHIGM